MKKIISVVGARPNFMKVAPIHRAFAEYNDGYKHIIVHTGQHYDKKMSGDFFEALELPDPDFFLGVGSASHAVQTAKIMVEFEKILDEVQPDLVLVVGDVNSTIACAITAVKKGIKLAHVEAGLRSFDRKMPEEINRIITDSISDYAFVTEESGRSNLIKENFPKENIFSVGNTMIDSLFYALPKADRSDIHKELAIKPKEYFLVTLHRPSNVDEEMQLKGLLEVLSEFAADSDVVFPMHPRTRNNIVKFGLEKYLRIDRLKITEPAGYVDFLALMKNAKLVITDSGGIQEETTALQVPCVTLRTSTERPVTCEIGTNMLTDPEPEKAKAAVEKTLKNLNKGRVPELWDGNAAERIAKIITNQLIG